MFLQQLLFTMQFNQPQQQHPYSYTELLTPILQRPAPQQTDDDSNTLAGPASKRRREEPEATGFTTLFANYPEVCHTLRPREEEYIDDWEDDWACHYATHYGGDAVPELVWARPRGPLAFQASGNWSLQHKDKYHRYIRARYESAKLMHLYPDRVLPNRKKKEEEEEEEEEEERPHLPVASPSISSSKLAPKSVLEQRERRRSTASLPAVAAAGGSPSPPSLSPPPFRLMPTTRQSPPPLAAAFRGKKRKDRDSSGVDDAEGADEEDDKEVDLVAAGKSITDVHKLVARHRQEMDRSQASIRREESVRLLLENRPVTPVLPRGELPPLLGSLSPLDRETMILLGYMSEGWCQQRLLAVARGEVDMDDRSPGCFQRPPGSLALYTSPDRVMGAPTGHLLAYLRAVGEEGRKVWREDGWRWESRYYDHREDPAFFDLFLNRVLYYAFVKFHLMDKRGRGEVEAGMILNGQVAEQIPQ